MATSGAVRRVVGRLVEDDRASCSGVVINGSGAVVVMALALALALEKQLTVRRVGSAMFLAARRSRKVTRLQEPEHERETGFSD